MQAKTRCRVLGLVSFCVLLAISLPASANSVPLTVTGYGYEGGTADGLGMTAGIFSASSALPDGPSEIGGGTVGVPMSLSFSAAAYPGPGPGFTEVNIGNLFTDNLSGGIVFTGTFTVPASALMTGKFTAPVNVSGEVQAYKDVPIGRGPLMATLLFSGKGTATFDIEPNGEGTFIIIDGYVNFRDKGTLTTTPEPGSLFLVGTGLAGLALCLKRRLS